MEELEQPTQNLGSKEDFGKFKDAESLLKAYNNLEAEFTKKSQRLAEIETQNEMATKQQVRQAEIDKKVNEFVAKFDIVKPFSSALKESLINGEANLEEVAVRLLTNNYKSADDYINDDEFLNNYVYSNTKIKDKIVKDYLSKITQNSPIKMETGLANISLSPPKIPKTIKEAGMLAKTIIKQK